MCVCVGFVYVWIKLNNWFETVKWSRKERGEKTTTKVDVYHVGRVGSISYDCAEIRKFRFGSQEFSVSQRLMDIFCKDAPFFWLHFSRYFCLFLSLSLSAPVSFCLPFSLCISLFDYYYYYYFVTYFANNSGIIWPTWEGIKQNTNKARMETTGSPALATEMARFSNFQGLVEEEEETTTLIWLYYIAITVVIYSLH